MANLTIKNIPEDLYEQLKEQAAFNRRSINSEVIVCIEKAVRGRRVSPESVLETARQLRERSQGYAIHDQDLTEARRSGRMTLGD
jgi:plasmid stability protein